MLKKMIFATSICILLCMLINYSGAIQKKQKKTEYMGPKLNRKLFGQPYVPKDVKLPKGFDKILSNWDICQELNGGEMKIKSIRLYGFDMLNHRNNYEPIDLIIKDPVVLKTVSRGVGMCFRYPVFDLSNKVGATGSGGYRGVMELRTNKGKTIIGISQSGYYLGVWYGVSRQMFFSWTLTKQIDDLVHKQTGQHLKYFDQLSGESFINANKSCYDAARKKKEKDGKNQEK